MGAELLLVSQQETAVEILAANTRDMATTKLVAKRFPDAVFKNGQWESASITTANAKGLVARHNGSTSLKTLNLELYVTVTPKGCEPVRVYSSNPYHLACGHVEAFFQDHPKLVLKVFGLVLRCFEVAPREA